MEKVSRKIVLFLLALFYLPFILYAVCLVIPTLFLMALIEEEPDWKLFRQICWRMFPFTSLTFGYWHPRGRE